MAWFVLMGEEGVESFKDFSFWSDPIGEVGVIVYIKEPLAFKTFPSTVHTHNINVLPYLSSPFLTAFHKCQSFLSRLFASFMARFELFEAMVSFQKVLAESPRPEIHADFEASSKKRKWEEPFAEDFFKDQTSIEKRKSVFDIDLRPDTPFSSDKWRQYLTVQSGQIQLHNIKTTTEDSKRNPEPPPSHHMSLNLELNLTCESLRKKEDSYDVIEKQSSGFPVGSSERDNLFNEPSKCKKDSDAKILSPSWLSSSEDDYKEMVATVCMQCHMLVMLCKSSPSCPNCKFMHPPDQNPSKFLKRRCSLFC
ncbi:hypothetical protein VNO78_01367 [Psophocarpus tetragonolobus]|uniref:Uncharacterized protein n=1 Tax=Psophocarpus tetragonolobus TaxID=3891 RepID=A0AAN9SY97_PSOTE